MERKVPVSAANVLNMDDLLTRCLGNLEFAERVLSMFQERGDEDLAGLERAVAARDADEVAILAHRLKGASANASAPGLQARAAEIERAARNESFSEIPARLVDLRHEWREFTSAVSLLGSRAESGA